jgi:hypothetical protein
VSDPVMLAIDVVLGALIGPPGTAAEMVIERAERGEWTPVLLDVALFCAMSSVRAEDVVDHARFARLLRHTAFAASHSREPGTAFEPPSPAEVEHWRAVALGLDTQETDNDAAGSCCS